MAGNGVFHARNSHRVAGRPGDSRRTLSIGSHCGEALEHRSGSRRLDRADYRKVPRQPDPNADL